jgi:hypothetical protein
MTDFLASMQTGINLAALVESNKAEIEGVFENLNSAIFSAFPKLSFSRVNSGKGLLSHGLKSLVIRNSESNSSRQIASFYEHEEGYPCRLSYGSQVFVCEDRESLELQLSVLLERDFVGRAILDMAASASERNLDMPESATKDTHGSEFSYKSSGTFPTDGT